MWAEKIDFPFENFKTPSTFSVCCHLMHCPSISCTSNFYENLKRFLADSLITFPLTTCMCASYMEVIVIKRKLVWSLSVPFHFLFFWWGGGRAWKPSKYIKADTTYKYAIAWFCQIRANILMCKTRICISPDLVPPSSLPSKWINDHEH